MGKSGNEQLKTSIQSEKAKYWGGLHFLPNKALSY